MRTLLWWLAVILAAAFTVKHPALVGAWLVSVGHALSTLVGSVSAA